MCQQKTSDSPNSLSPNEIAVYPSLRMPRRRRGILEERLRAEIARRVRGHKGENKHLAEALGRPPSWVTEYIDGENHANLDTSLALMRYVGWSLDAELKNALQPDIDPDLLAALRNEDVVTVVTDLLRLMQRPKALATVVATVRVTADLLGAPKSSAPNVESVHETLPAASTRQGRAPRRAARGSKAHA